MYRGHDERSSPQVVLQSGTDVALSCFHVIVVVFVNTYIE